MAVSLRTGGLTARPPRHMATLLKTSSGPLQVNGPVWRIPTGRATPAWRKLGLHPSTTTQRVDVSHESWEPISVSREEFPELVLEDIALFYADIYVQWRDVTWWVCRIHHTSAASALPVLSAPNYVVVTERDYEAFFHRPFGLVELVIGRSAMSLPPACHDG